MVSDATSSPATVSLSGTGVTLLLSASPSTLSFGNVTVGNNSSRTVTLTDSGTGSVTVSQATVSGVGFGISALSLPRTLTSGQSVTFNAIFAPTTTGSVSGTISVVGNATNSPAAVTLGGTGVTGLLLGASPASLSFGNVTVGSSGCQTVTLTNTGTVRVTVSQVTVSGVGFSISAFSLPMTLTSGQSVTFNATFAPTTAGGVTGSISVASNASNSPATVGLSGTGITLLITASPASTNFGNVVLGSSSTLPVILTNTGTGSVTISQDTVNGKGFSVSGPSLPLTLSAGQNAGFNVTFAPSGAGSVSGNDSFTSNATNSPANEALSGTGIHAVNLSWTASTSTVAGYNAYRGTASGRPYTELNSSLVTGTAYTDTTVKAGQAYYYVMTSVDSNNNESAYSNEVVVAVPSP